MDISNMILSNLKGDTLIQITEKIGGDNAATKAIAAKALPMILDQLSKNTQTEQGAESLNNALNSHLGKTQVNVDDGADIMGHIFANKDEVIVEVAKVSGQSPEQTAGVMGGLSSIIMETLGDQKKAAGGFGVQDLMKILTGAGKDSEILGMVMDQDGDGDFDKNDAMKFGMDWLKKKLGGK